MQKLREDLNATTNRFFDASYFSFHPVILVTDPHPLSLHFDMGLEVNLTNTTMTSFLRYDVLPSSDLFIHLKINLSMSHFILNFGVSLTALAQMPLS